MPDEPKEKVEEGGKEPQTGVPVEQVTELVNSFKDAVKASAAAPAAPEPPKEDEAERQKRLQAEWDDAKNKANEMAAEGDAAGAMEYLWGYVNTQAANNRPDVSNDPGYKAMREQAEALTRQEHKEMFDKYGDEIRRTVESMPPEKQIGMEAWQDAVRQTRATHIDDVLAEEKRKWEESRSAQVPVAGAGDLPKGEGGGTSADLTDAEKGVAKSFGLTEEEYAAAKEAIGEPDATGGYYGVSILGDDLPEKGKF